MIVKNCSIEDLNEALRDTNTSYRGNLRWNREPEKYRGGVRFTLRVKDSNGEGARRSNTGNRLISACWHAHGDFFDNLLNINPAAIVVTTHCVIEADGTDRNGDTEIKGNWRDYSIGSPAYPMLASEACEC